MWDRRPLPSSSEERGRGGAWDSGREGGGKGEGEREKGVREKGRTELEVRGTDLLGGWRVGVQLQQSSPVGDVGMQFLNRGREGG